MLILAFPDYQSQAERLAQALAVDLKIISLHRFPDGESLVRLPQHLPEHVIICRSLNQPNDKLIELMLCATTARRLGASRITLVAPYLCYMRQDIENQPGEAVSQSIVGHMLAELFDDVITVDPHLHRINKLSQAIPIKNAVSVTAAGNIAKFLKQRFDDAVLLGPDSESRQWVSAIGKRIGFNYCIAEKQRKGDKKVEIVLTKQNYAGKTFVIIDDMASTGRTIASAAELLLSSGANQVHAVITHPLFCGDAEAFIRKAGVQQIWSTDSICHPSAMIHLDKLLAGAVRDILET